MTLCCEILTIETSDCFLRSFCTIGQNGAFSTTEQIYKFLGVLFNYSSGNLAFTFLIAAGSSVSQPHKSIFIVFTSSIASSLKFCFCTSSISGSSSIDDTPKQRRNSSVVPNTMGCPIVSSLPSSFIN